MRKFLSILLLLLVSFTSLSQTVAFPKDHVVRMGDGKLLGGYRFEIETQEIFNRANEEGFTLPNWNTRVAINVLIKDMKANGYWQNLDAFYNFNYNDASLANFSLINWKNPRSITNLVTSSSNWADSSWGTGASTKTPNTLDTAAPDGTFTACKFDDAPTTGSGIPLKSNIVATGGVITYSIYTKAGTATTRVFLLRNQTTATNFTTGTLNYSTGSIAGSGWTATNVGNGWYRLSYTRTADINSGDLLTIYYGRTTSATGGPTWYVWHPQVENRNTASKYIATNATAIHGNGVASAIAGVTYTTTGWVGNGVNGYIATAFNPSKTGLNYTTNNAGFSFITTTAVTGSGSTAVLIGQPFATNAIFSNRNSNNVHRVNTNLDLDAAPTLTTAGYKGMYRTSSAGGIIVDKSTSINWTAASSTVPDDGFSLLRRSALFSTQLVSAADFGAAMTYSQVQTHRTNYQSFCTKISSTVVP